MDLSELDWKNAFKKFSTSLVWGIGSMIVGGFIAEWAGAALALAILCYWKLCAMTIANPLISGLLKATKKLEKRQTINKVLIQDLAELREEVRILREKIQ